MDVTSMDTAADSDELLRSRYGTRPLEGWRGLRRPRLIDFLFDAGLAANRGYRELVRKARVMDIQRIHVASVDVPQRRDDLAAVLRTLKQSRHRVSTSLAPIGDRGKFQNINLALCDVDLRDIDWLIVVDDDVGFPPDFLDRFVCACDRASLRIAQPAHRFKSHTTWQVTQRIWNSLVHLTHFVECGPLTMFHRDVFGQVLPFPETRWAWGLDVIWGELARRHDFRIGVVDATPISHLRPIADVYDSSAAASEARLLLEKFGVRRSNREILETTAVLTRL